MIPRFITRFILAGALLQIGAFAQLQFFQFDGTNDTAIGSVYNAGSVATCDKLVTRFHVKNMSTQGLPVVVSVTGAGFSNPDVHGINGGMLAPLTELEFDVTFTPPNTGTYNGTITANSLTATIQAAGVSGSCLSSGPTQVNVGGIADFGSVQSGTTVRKQLTLNNPSTTGPLTVSSITVSGNGFQGPTGITLPAQIAAGGTATFQVAFAPQSPGPATGTLSVDGKTFNLTGLGTNPPLPQGSIVVSSQTATSSQQLNISVALASTSKVAGSGTLTMQFQPANGLPDDAAVQFLSGAKRNATFTIAPGDSVGKFGSQGNIAFQTGTTAGTIVFTLTLPNSSDQFTLPVSPAVVNFSTSTATRRIDAIDVNLAGFDNTHSVSQLGFTFYDTTGHAIQPGMIRVDATPDFSTYFKANPAYGGLFTLLATFPVTGDTSKITAVDVQVANTAGLATTQRITF